jgi:phospholipase C
MKGKLTTLLLAVALGTPHASSAQEGLAKIKTIVVIYAENRSFDHLYGFFPGVNGIANATAEQKTQLDHDGTPLPYLTIFGSDGILRQKIVPALFLPREWHHTDGVSR